MGLNKPQISRDLGDQTLIVIIAYCVHSAHCGRGVPSCKETQPVLGHEALPQFPKTQHFILLPPTVRRP